MPDQRTTYTGKKNILVNNFRDLSETNPLVITVYNLTDITFLKQNIAKQTKYLQFLSSLNAAAYLGVRGWLALMKLTQKVLRIVPDHMLDCGCNGGLAMAALRLGQKKIIFDSTSPQFKTLVYRATDLNSQILPSRPKSLDLASPKTRQLLKRNVS